VRICARCGRKLGADDTSCAACGLPTDATAIGMADLTQPSQALPVRPPQLRPTARSILAGPAGVDLTQPAVPEPTQARPPAEFWPEAQPPADASSATLQVTPRPAAMPPVQTSSATLQGTPQPAAMPPAEMSSATLQVTARQGASPSGTLPPVPFQPPLPQVPQPTNPAGLAATPAAPPTVVEKAPPADLHARPPNPAPPLVPAARLAATAAAPPTASPPAAPAAFDAGPPQPPFTLAEQTAAPPATKADWAAPRDAGPILSPAAPAPMPYRPQPPPPVRPPARRARGRWLVFAVAAAVLLVAGGGTALAFAGFRHHGSHNTAAGHRPAGHPRSARRNNTPAPSPSSAASARRLVALAPGVAAEPDAVAVRRLLSRYFTAINRHRFVAFRHLLAPEARHGMTIAHFTAGYGTTTDSSVVLRGISATSAGQVAAHVTFVSHQAAADSPTKSACTRWDLTLYLDRAGTRFLVGLAPANSATGTACG
jgi:hypothetical protein